MPAFTAVGVALGAAQSTAFIAGASAIGTGISVAGQVIQSQESAKAEGIRKRQMLQEAARKQREIFRQSQLARATALSNSAQQGSLDSSVFGGAVGQIVTQTGQQTQALAENTANSSALFDANAQQAFGQSIASTGKGLSSLASTIVSVQPEINKLGKTIVPGLWDTITKNSEGVTL